MGLIFIFLLSLLLTSRLVAARRDLSPAAVQETKPYSLRKALHGQRLTSKQNAACFLKVANAKHRVNLLISEIKVQNLPRCP